MCGKIQAMADARASDETLIIARSDAIAVEGFEAAMERGAAYIEAGADALFIEAPRSIDELRKVGEILGRRVPLMANMVEGGSTPMMTPEDLQALGFSLVIFPGGIVRALARTAEDYYASLRTSGSNLAFKERMFDFGGDMRMPMIAAVPRDGVDRDVALADIERVEFLEGTLALDVGVGETSGFVYRVYQAAYDRTPDDAGVKFWIDAVDDGLDFNSVADGFLQSNEFEAVYGVNPSNETYVEMLYENVLGRAPDVDGSDFWVDALDDG